MNETETKEVKLYMKPEGSEEWIEWNGIKSITADTTGEPVDTDTLWLGSSIEGTFEFKTPKFWRCKNRKRFKKLLMSEGISRDFVDCYLQELELRRNEHPGFCYSYQWLWDQTRSAIHGL